MLITVGPFHKGTSLETYRTLLHSCDCYTWLEKLAPTIFGEQSYLKGRHFSTEISCFVEQEPTPTGRQLETFCVNPGPAELKDLANRLAFAAQQLPEYRGERNNAEILQYRKSEPQLVELIHDDRVA